MTQEEKQLLLITLCGMLPYGVVCKISYTFNNETTNWEDVESICDDTITKINFDTKEVFSDWLSEYSSIDDAKPYLRPMSSMTEKEKKVYDKLRMNYYKLFSTESSSNLIDWLNEHHFDYRVNPVTGKSMIDMELAIEAPGDMYKTE